MKDDQDILTRIDRSQSMFETREAEVQAFLPEEGRFDRLRREAEGLITRYPDARIRPALFGMLVGVKDIFHVDGFPTRAGSRLPPEALQGAEAESVRLLKAAGALVAGKTVTTEFAYFAPGPTRNPHNPEHTPGGSSSGSAAAVATRMCDLALGTQTIGSILRPAAFCGVVGFKPTYERISREGVIPLAPALDHVGFFTGNVKDAIRAAAILIRDWHAFEMPAEKPVLGIPEGAYLGNVYASGQVHFKRTLQILVDAGYELRRVAAMSDFAIIRSRHELILAAEAARVHTGWFGEYADLYAPKTAELIRRGLKIHSRDLERGLDERLTLQAELHERMEAYQIDLWISPSAPGTAPRGLESTGDPVMNLPWTQAGLPALNLPSGKDPAGLPFGLQVTGRWHADEALLGWALELEEVLIA